MSAAELERAAELVRERPYLSPLDADAFEMGLRDHADPSCDCAGGAHCFIEMKAREALQIAGAR